MSEKFAIKSAGDNGDGVNVYGVVQVGSGETRGHVWEVYRWLGDI